MLPYKRSERLAEQIQHAVSQIILELKDPDKGFITVTGAKLTDDLKTAVIYYSVMGSEQEIKRNVEIVEKNISNIRYNLAHSVKFKRVPALKFEYDETPFKAGRVFELLEQVKKEENA